MTQILDGKAAAAEIRAEMAASVREMAAAGHRMPQLVAVLVGEDAASQTYVGSKVRGCGEVGMLSRNVRLPSTTSQALSVKPAAARRSRKSWRWGKLSTELGR